MKEYVCIDTQACLTSTAQVMRPISLFCCLPVKKGKLGTYDTPGLNRYKQFLIYEHDVCDYEILNQQNLSPGWGSQSHILGGWW